MKNKAYKVTLEIDTVDKALEKSLGAKLSPIINKLLKAWVKFPEVHKYLLKIQEEENKEKS